jgi:cytochrome c553
VKNLKMCPKTLWAAAAATLVLAIWTPARAQNNQAAGRSKVTADDDSIDANALKTIDQGRQTFRFETFGDETFWGDTIKLHQAVATLSPRKVLALGLKVDADALPKKLRNQLKHGALNLDDPANTAALLKLNAVVGLTGFFDGSGNLNSIGTQCALCHSTVDNSLAPGIGKRLDGWPNRDLNIGAIIASAPDLSSVATLLGVDQNTVREVLNAWGPGKFDAELFLDGKGFRPDGATAAVLIPPAFGLAGVNLHTWTGAWGTVTYWNAFVANLEMHGSGTFFDPRLDDAAQFPVAAKAGSGHLHANPDLVTPKLAALQFYQLAIPAPRPAHGSFDQAAAQSGRALFNGKAQCSTCHTPPLMTEPGWNLHTPEEVCVDDFEANRAPDHRYRTSPLGGLWTHTKGGFYHDGRFATLNNVVDHYNSCLSLNLSDSEKTEIVEYLKSLPE